MGLTVLMHPPPHSPATSPYVASLARSLEDLGVRVVGLGFRSLIRSDQAVIHIHWPEHFFGDGDTIKSGFKLALGSMLIRYANARGHSLIWTAHNVEPHGGWARGAAAAASKFRRLIDAFVVLCDGQQTELLDAFPELRGVRSRVIPEGQLHATEPFPVERRAEREPVRMLHLGMVSPYKAQVEVLEGLTELLVAHEVELKIVGRVDGSDYSNTLEDMAASLPGVELVQERVPDEELLNMLEWSDVAIGVQLPAFNTGVAAAAIPLGRPVVLSSGSQHRFLHDELGHLWCFAIADPRSVDEWRNAVSWAKEERGPAPQRFFDWSERAKEHIRLYTETVVS